MKRKGEWLQRKVQGVYFKSCTVDFARLVDYFLLYRHPDRRGSGNLCPRAVL